MVFKVINKGGLVKVNNRIVEDVNRLFMDKPQTKKIQEFKEELFGNLEEKYSDLISEGKSEEEAYHILMDSMGDINEVVMNLIDKESLNEEKIQKEKEKTARVVTIAVGLYILALMVMVFFDEYVGVGIENIKTCSFLLISGSATCLLIYHFLSRPNYEKKESRLIDDLSSLNLGTKQRKKIFHSIIWIMWLIVLLLYFLVSFVFWNWYCSWIIFIVGIVIQHIIKLVFDICEMREKNENIEDK